MSIQRKINRRTFPHVKVFTRDRDRNGNKPDKGMKDGSCNRTACQAPLNGRLQFWMPNLSTTNGRLYYCGRCEADFREWDMKMVAIGEQKPDQGWTDHRGYRCRPDEGNEAILKGEASCVIDT